MWSSEHAKVSKKRHVRRAVSRSARASSSERGSVLATREGRLIQRATTGDSIQRRTNGAATGNTCGRAHATRTLVTTASATALLIQW